MTIRCEVKEATSKNGNVYKYLAIYIGSYEKKVFLEQAELELLKLYSNPQK